MGIELSGTGRGNEESYSRSSRVKRFHGLVPYLDPDTWTVSIEWDDGDAATARGEMPKRAKPCNGERAGKKFVHGRRISRERKRCRKISTQPSRTSGE